MTRAPATAPVATVLGELTLPVWERSARGWLFADGTEEHLYIEAAKHEADPSGNSVTSYTVLEEDNPVYGQTIGAASETRYIDPNLLTQPTASTSRHVYAKVNLPPLQARLPVPPDLFPDSASYQAVKSDRDAQRQALLSARQQTIAQVESWLRGLGAVIRGSSPRSGWISMDVPMDEIGAVASSDDILILFPFVGGDSACDSSCTTSQPNYGEWTLGGSGTKERLDFDRFHGAGHDGRASNSSRHSYGDLVASVIERYPNLEDEGCFLADIGDCEPRRLSGGRLDRTYECGFGTCWQVDDLDDESALNPSHGTKSASIILADFEQAQAGGYEYGDYCWDGLSHCDWWETNSTGLAPEALLHFYADEETYQAAETSAITYPDVVNLSTIRYEGTACDTFFQSPTADALEDAFDAGAFVVASAGNDGFDQGCNIEQIGMLPKSLAVNSVEAGFCETDYSTCAIEESGSSLGGAGAQVGGQWISEALAVVDFAAPTFVSQLTVSTEAPSEPQIGRVSDSGWGDGSSTAAPHVAGAALLVKDWFLSGGHTWVNNPGRLQAIMLGMTDRGDGVSTRMLTGRDTKYGAGRLKLRLLKNGEGFGPWGWSVRTKTMQLGSSDYDYLPFSYPIPSGAELLKCSVFEAQDVNSPSRDDLQDIWVKVTLRSPVNGSCSLSGSYVRSRSDWSYDTRHMVSFEDSSTNIEGLCPAVTFVNAYVDRATTTTAFCYYAGVDDYSPN